MTGEKTEQPTQKKLEDQAEKGQTAQRKNVVEAVVMTSGVLLVYAFASRFWDQLRDVFEIVYRGVAGDMDNLRQAVIDTVLAPIQTIIIIAMSLGLVAMFSNFFFNNFNFAPKALTPKIDKMNPVNTIKGIFSITTIYNFIRMIIMFVGISMIMVLVIWNNFPLVMAAAYCGASCLVNVFPEMIKVILVLILMLILLLSIADFRAQTAMFKKQNKMSKDDVKREHKGQEGDPEVKGQRKSLMYEDAVMPSPKDATHLIFGNGFAVSLIFVEGNPPFIVAKYRTNKLDPVIQLYRRMGVTCVQAPAVATNFHRWFPMFTEADKRAASGMVQVLEIAGQI